MSVKVARDTFTTYRFTVEEYRRMGETGILSEDDRVELIEGEIIQMSPIGERHAACVDALAEALRDRLGRSVIIRVQSSIRLDKYSQPQPDITILKRRDDFYRHAHPGPEDILLVIEVSDKTLKYDQKIKVPLYARAGIPEVWLVNVPGERLKAYADLAEGAYQTISSYARGEEVQSHALAALRLNVSKIFG